MSRSIIGSIAVAMLIITSASPLSAEDGAARVRSELANLHSWLGQDANADKWRTYLQSANLEQELNAGPQANLSKVAHIQGIYSQLRSDLRLPHFVAVEQSLRSWLDELTQAYPDQLSAAAKAASAQFTPVSEQQVQQERSRLLSAARSFDQYLSGGGPAIRANWHRYLRWEELQAELDKPDPDSEIMFRVFRLFSRNEKGLELAPFRQFRESINRFRHLASASGIQREQYVERMDKLAQTLESYRTTLKPDEAAEIGHTLGWLEAAGQAPGLVSAVRKAYWNPNLWADASAELIAAGVEDTVHDTQPVDDYFQGTHLVGFATTTGRLGVSLIPSDHGACLELSLIGCARSRNTGYHGRVTICSNGTTDIHARRRLSIDEWGLQGHPAVAECSTISQIEGVSAGSRLVEKFAMRRAQSTKPEAEAWASGKAEYRVAGRMERQSNEILATANSNFTEKFRNPLIRLGAYPRTLKFSSTDRRIHVTGLHAEARHLAAPTPPPPSPESHDVRLRVHESLVGNFSETLIGGETLTDERLEKMIRDLTNDVPEELRISPDKDPWSITFAADRPVNVRFDEDLVTITIRGRRFTRQDQELRNAVDISATYKIVMTDNSTRLLRQGEVNVDFVNRARLGVTQVTFKTFLRKKFDALFKEEIVSEGLKLKGRWESQGKLKLAHALAQKGWLSLAWDRTAKTATMAQATAQVVR